MENAVSAFEGGAGQENQDEGQMPGLSSDWGLKQEHK